MSHQSTAYLERCWNKNELSKALIKTCKGQMEKKVVINCKDRDQVQFMSWDVALIRAEIEFDYERP